MIGSNSEQQNTDYEKNFEKLPPTPTHKRTATSTVLARQQWQH